MFDILIKNGLIVTAEGSSLQDMAIAGEKIARISPEINEHAMLTIDAAGKYLLPGLVDVRCDFLPKSPDQDAITQLTLGSRSAIFGGVTTVLQEITPPEQSDNLWQLIREQRSLLKGHCYADFGFHYLLNALSQDSLSELDILVEQGVSSVNVELCGSLAFPSQLLPQLFARTKETGVLPCLHTADEAAIKRMEELLAQQRLTGPYYHSISRPNSAEAQAIAAVLDAAAKADDAPVYLQRVSCRESLEKIRQARSRSRLPIYLETCPHYLLLDSRSYFTENARSYLVEPPLRSPSDKRQLWSALGKGNIQVVTSDHRNLRLAEKTQITPGRPWDFRECPPGIPGGEYYLDLLHHFGVRQGKISIERLVSVCCTNPALLMGLYPQKGQLAVGADADVIIYDSELRHSLQHQEEHGSDYCPYQGQKVVGGVHTVLLRGKPVVQQGQLLESMPRGRFIPRARSMSAR